MTNVRMRRFFLLVGFLCLSAVVNAAAIKDKYSEVYFTVIEGNAYIDKPTNGTYSGDVIIPATVTDGSKNPEVTYNVIGIYQRAFKDTKDLNSVSFPNSLKEIRSGAFQNSGIASISLPKSLEKIRDNAFAGTNITTVTIPYTVTDIEGSAFSGCKYLSSVIILAQDPVIGKDAFKDCTNLEEATFYDKVSLCERIDFQGQNSNPLYYAPKLFFNDAPTSLVENIDISEGVTIINRYAFINCESLKEVTIGSGVTSIGEEAFSGCKNLETVSIPQSVNNIGNNAFNNDSKLKKAIFYDEESLCKIEYANPTANPLYNAKNLYFANESDILVETISIPKAGLKNGRKIRPYILAGATCIKRVNLPQEVDSIGTSAFENCNNLKMVQYHDEAQLVSMAYENGTANPQCYGANVVFETGEYNDGRLVFTKNIKANAFSNAKWLISVELTTDVDSIGSGAFNGCPNLESITIPSNSKLKYIGTSAFKECKNIESPKLENANQLKRIDNNAFDNCLRIKKIKIPDNCKLGNSAFNLCTALDTIFLPAGLDTIPDNLLAKCYKLKGITIPKSVKVIGKNAFQECTNLTNFPTLEKNSELDIVLDGAFLGCTGFKNLIIPESVTDIRKEAFLNCKNVEILSLPSSLAHLSSRVFAGCDSLKNVYALSSTPPSVQPSTFNEKESKMKLYVDNSVKGDYEGADTWKNFNIDAKKKIKIIYYLNDEKLDSIVQDAGSLVIRGSIPQPSINKEKGEIFSGWDKDAPEIMPSDKDLEIFGYKSWIKSYDKLVYHLQPKEEKNGKNLEARATVIGVDTANITGNDREFIIPKYVPNAEDKGMEYPVIAIGPRAFDNFKNKSQIEKIIFPENKSIKNVGAGAFRGCNKLIQVENFDGVTEINDSVFHNCSYLKSISFSDKVKEIHRLAFSGCSSLNPDTLLSQLDSVSFQAFANTGIEAVTVAKGTALDDEVFKGCTKLKTVTFVDGYNRALPKRIFWNCDSLKNVTMRGTMHYILDGAFKGCKSLTTFDVPDGITMLNNEAFMGCRDLRSITIPGSIKNIYDRAFANCDTLRNIMVNRDNPPELIENAFDKATYERARLFVKTPDNYKNHKIWGKFTKENVTTRSKYYLTFYINDTINRRDSIYVGATIDESFRNYKPDLSDGDIFSGWNKEVPILMPSDNIQIYGYISKKKKEGFFIYHLQPAEDKNGKGLLDRATLIGVDTMAISENDKDLIIPNYIEDKDKNDNIKKYSVTAIGVRAFANYKYRNRIETITLPKDIAVVDTAAFKGCQQMWQVKNFEGIKHVSNSTFYNCSNLTDITLSKDVTIIDTLAFYGCSSFTLNKGLPSQLDSIRYQAFANTGIKTIKIAKDKKVFLDDEVFKGCTKLDTVEFCGNYSEKSLPKLVFWNCNALKKVIMGNSMESIHEGAFKGCSSLTSFVIPDNIKLVGNEAFMGCSQLTAITLPASVNNIRDRAFAGCDTLQTITAKPNTPPTLIENAFSEKTYKKATLYVDKVDDYDVSPWNKFSRQKSGKYVLTYILDADTIKSDSILVGNSVTPRPDAVKEGHEFSGWQGEPESMPSNDVVVTGKFKYKLSFKRTNDQLPADDKFSLPKDKWYFFGDSIKTEALKDSLQWAKYRCKLLTGIPEVMPAKDSVILVQYDLAEQDTTINNINYKVYLLKGKAEVMASPNVSGTITIPSKIEYEGKNYDVVAILDGAFSGNREISAMTLPDSIASIGENAFFDNRFTTFVIPSKVKSIGKNAFLYCTSMETLTLGDSITEIPAGAFRNCYALKSVDLPKSVKKIGKEAFSGSDNLKMFKVNSKVMPEADSLSFSSWQYNNTSLRMHDDVVVGHVSDSLKYLPKPWRYFVDKARFSDPESAADKCPKPEIANKKGKLEFSCSDKNATIYNWIEVDDVPVQKRNGKEYELKRIYNIKAYAHKDGWINSDIATAQITWRNGTPTFEGFTGTPSIEKSIYSDVDGDGHMTTSDATEILKILVGQ